MFIIKIYGQDQVRKCHNNCPQLAGGDACPTAAIGHLGTIQPVGGWDLPGSAS